MEATVTNPIIEQLRAEGLGKQYTPPAQEPPAPPAEPTPVPTPEPVAPVEQTVQVEDPAATPAAAPVPDPAPAPAVPAQPSGAEIELAALKQKLAEVEAKAALEPFASPLVKKVNEIIASGGSLTEINRFIELQSIDVDALSNEDAIKQAWRLENPALNEREINAMYNQKYGADPDDDDAAVLASARLKTDVLGARAKLSEQKLKSVPETVRQAELEQQRIAQSEQAWTPVVAGLGQKLDFSLTEDGVNAPFEYVVPDNVLAGARQRALKWAAANKVPLDQGGAQAVQEFMRLDVWAQKGNEIAASIARSAYERGMQAAKAAEAGVPAPTPSVEVTAGQTTFDQIKAGLKAQDMRGRYR